MLFTAIAWICLGLALIPLTLIVWNLFLLRRLPAGTSTSSISVLIPARDEAGNIDAAISSVLANRAQKFELIVLDDDSGDETAAIVAAWSQRDDRVRLLSGRTHDPSLWGKPQACAALADSASGDYLLFMDADVRLEADALRRISRQMDRSGIAMLSGVPRQLTDGLTEKLIVPLIHFVLLGFLPLAGMRASPMPDFGVACGQLLAVRRDAYRASGGHREVADRIHDGMALARRMRQTGHMTDIADFSDIASCRMYRNAPDLIAGFAKNAHEGLGSPRGILPWTLLLICGQVLWLMLLPFTASTALLTPLLLTGLSGLLARALLDIRFRQFSIGSLLQPIGVLLLVLIQWYALARRLSGHPVAWKARVASREDSPVSKAEPAAKEASVAADRPLSAGRPGTTVQRSKELVG